MRVISCSLLVVVALLITGAAQAQEQEPKGWLGLQVENLTKQEVEKRGLAHNRGVRVMRPLEGGPAAAAGVATDDILLSVDGKDVADTAGFLQAVQAHSPGAQVQLRLTRGGVEQTVTVTLGKRLAEQHGPQLMLDTGGHMASVVSVAITSDGKQIVSASNDKTIRVWDIETGKTMRMIRGEAAPGHWGSIYAMAMSRDGRRLAVGGFLHETDRVVASAIRIYDFATGSLETLLKGHENVVYAVSFSPDGQRLISGSGDKTAILWDLNARKPIVRLSGHTEAIKAVTFTGDSERVVTGGQDETLRLWSVADGKLIAEMTEHKHAAQREAAQLDARLKKDNESKKSDPWHAGIVSVDVLPVGPMIASGSADGRILLWDGRTGAFMRQLAFPGGMRGMSDIASLRFSPDGQWLLSASKGEGCQIYDVATGGGLYDGKVSDKPLTMFDVRHVRCNGGTSYSPDGRLAAAGYNSTVQVVDARTSKAIKTLQSSGEPVFGVGFAQDGRSIAWGHTTDREADAKWHEYKLTRRLPLPLDGRPLTGSEDIDASAPGKYARRSSTQGQLSVAFKRGPTTASVNVRYLEIFKDGKLQTEIDLRDSRGVASSSSPLAFTPDGQAIIIGLTPEIQAYDLSGRFLGHLTGHNGQVRDLAFSADGRFLVSGSSDQTVRLWNLQTRELIASLFRGTDGEWVMWTPQGYYASSPNGDRTVGWQINKGSEQAAEYVTASQLRHRFYRPDIVERAIVLGSAGKAVEEAGLAGAGSFQLPDLAKRLPPKLSILSPSDGSETMRGRAAVTLALAETADDPVKDFEVFVNDTKVTAATTREGANVSFEAPLGQGSNRIRLVARSKADLLGEAQLEITQNGEGMLDKRDTLFIVAIGVDKYPQMPKTCGAQANASCDLVFAGADAKAFAATVEKQMGGQHTRVVLRVLVNGAGDSLEPTRDNIENAFDLLLEAKDNDTVAVFVAGHGYSDARSGYQFLPTNARMGEGGNFASASVIKWTTLEGAIQAAKGRRLLFVDTCRSGSAFNARLIKDASDNGIVAYSATNTQQDALELANLGHGVFTHALIRGLNGAADLAQEQEVRVFDLGAFVEREVRKLTNGRQTPDFYKKPGAENFVLVRMLR